MSSRSLALMLEELAGCNPQVVLVMQQVELVMQQVELVMQQLELITQQIVVVMARLVIGNTRSSSESGELG